DKHPNAGNVETPQVGPSPTDDPKDKSGKFKNVIDKKRGQNTPNSQHQCQCRSLAASTADKSGTGAVACSLACKRQRGSLHENAPGATCAVHLHFGVRR